MNAKQPSTATERSEPHARADQDAGERTPEIVVLPHAAMPVSDEELSSGAAPSLEDERGAISEPMS